MHESEQGQRCGWQEGEEEGFEERWNATLLPAAGAIIVGTSRRHSHVTVYVQTRGDAALMGATLNVYAKGQNATARIASFPLTTQAALAAVCQTFTPSPDDNPCDGYDVEILPVGTPTIPTLCTVVAHGWESCCADTSSSGGTPATNLISFVSPNGSDTTGDGTIEAPFKTIQKAGAVLHVSPTTPGLVAMMPGTYPSLTALPYVYYAPVAGTAGAGPGTVTITANLALDPSWATPVVPVFGGATGLNILGNATIDYTVGTGVAAGSFNLAETYIAGNLTLKGNGALGGQLITQQSQVLGTVSNTAGQMTTTDMQAVGLITQSSSATGAATWASYGDSAAAGVTIDATAGKNVTANLIGTGVVGTLTLKNGGGGVTSYTATAGGVPSTVVTTGGAAVPVPSAPLLGLNSKLATGANATSGFVATADGAGNISWLASSGGSAITSLTGDVTATGPGAAAATVVRINGATVPAAGALTTGNVPQVTGASALGYAAVNLAGGANFVTGQLPIGNLGHGTAAQVPVTNAGATAVAFVTLSQDFSITAAGAATITQAQAGALAWTVTTGAQVWASTATPSLSQSTTAGATAANLAINPQQSSNATPTQHGSVTFTIGGVNAPTNEASLSLFRAAEAQPRFRAGTFVGGTTTGMVWVASGTVTPTLNNPAIISDGGTFTYVNTSTGAVAGLVGNATFLFYANTSGLTLASSGQDFGGSSGAVISFPAVGAIPTSFPATNVLLYATGQTIGTASKGITVSQFLGVTWAVSITAAAATNATVNGQGISFTAQPGVGNSTNSGTAGVGGAVTLAGGAGGVESGTTSTGGAGGNVVLTAGNGGTGTTTNGVGGNIVANVTGFQSVLLQAVQSSVGGIGTQNSQSGVMKRYVVYVRNSTSTAVVFATIAVPASLSIGCTWNMIGRLVASPFSPLQCAGYVGAANNGGTVSITTVTLATVAPVATVQVSGTNITISVAQGVAAQYDWTIIVDVITN